MTETVTITSSECEGLRFVALDADERLGQLFSFHVQFESAATDIDLSGLLGSSMTVTLTTQEGFKRYFNGMVVRASQVGIESIDNLVYAKYEVELAPKPWLLRQKVDCRIFKHLNVPEIVREVLGEAGYSDVTLSLSASYAGREYCVQYREDCFNFISRLMEQEGIYYYFTHAEGVHTMVLADGLGAHQVIAGFNRVAFSPDSKSVLLHDPVVGSWATQRGVDKSSYALTDYNPLTPKTSLWATASSDGHEGSGANVEMNVFDYPGTQIVAGVGRHYAQVRAEALTAWRSRYSAATSCCSASVGGLFTLTGYPRSELNREYLIVDSNIHLQVPSREPNGGPGKLSWTCSFGAIESSIPFRSMQSAHKPTIPGLQTAIVAGGVDEDIVIDQHGRVQVNFHWNIRPDRQNTECSCPVRVASMWAGPGWGAVHYPRVGHEVVVSFIEGDPDRPLIIGSVYNADNKQPYDTNDNKTQSGIKSRSLQCQPTDYNELRFEDKAGQEDFAIQAQKDMHETVKNDHIVTINHDEKILIKNDQTAEIKHDRTHTVTNDDKLTVNNDGTTTIAHNFKLSAGDQIELVCGQASITLKSSGEIDIKGSTITINGQQKVDITGQMGVAVSGMKLDLKADMAATLKGLTVAVSADAKADVKGAMVNVTGSGMVKVGGGIVMLG